MFEILLNKLSVLISSPGFIEVIKNKKLNGYSPHIHAEWELKFFQSKVEIVPPRTIHISSCQNDFLGGILVNENELRISGWGYKFPLNLSLDENSPPLEKLIDTYTALPKTENICREEIARSLFKLLKNELSCRTRNTTAVDMVQNVADYLERHYFHCDLSISEISEHTGFSQQYLNRKFKAVHGCSIQQELIKIRLQHAQQMLLSGNYLVSDVAQLTGWRNAFYFSNVYRRHFGYPPSDTLKIIEG